MLETRFVVIAEALERLTPKERDVLDLVLERRTTKEIARALQVAPNTVDMRLRAARAKLGAADRNETARLYAHLIETCGKTTCGPAVMAGPKTPPVAAAPEITPLSEYVFNDAAGFAMPAPWTPARGEDLSEVLDARFGKVWRVAAIPLGALGIAMIVAALIGIALMLGMLI